MKKQVYETPEMTVVMFNTADVITTSGICALAAGRGESSTTPPNLGDESGGAASETGGCGLTGSDSGSSGCVGVGPTDCSGGDAFNGGGGSSTGGHVCDGSTGANGGVH